MRGPISLYRLYLIISGLFLLSCAVLSAPSTPEPDLVATEVAVQKAAAAILTAEAPTEVPTEVPTETAALETAAPTPVPSPVVDTLPTNTPPPPTPTPAVEQAQQPLADTATPTPLCTIIANGLNMRAGPGTVYAPPLGALPGGMDVIPVAYSPIGYPGGQWLQVQGGGQLGWISVDSQYVRCNANLEALPMGVAPPTPTSIPLPTNTAAPPPPPRRRYVPPDGGDDLDHRIFPTAKIFLPDNAEIKGDGTVIFHNIIVIQLEVYDPNKGSSDGAGIREVRFTINSQDTGQVHRRTEQTAGYCVFGGGEPNCDVRVASDHNNRWPDGLKIQENTNYSVDFRVILEDGEQVNWMLGRIRFELDN